MIEHSEPVSNPFVGPRPFAEEEERLFFGRTREIDAIRALIKAYRIVLLYAQSGAGKSSLINAGVVPNLRRQGFEVFPVARVGHPVADQDADRKGNVFARSVISSWIAASEQPSLGATLHDFLSRRPHPVDADGLSRPRLVVIDQFEELFTTHQEHSEARATFLEQLAEASEKDAFLRVLVVMREEFLARLDPLLGILPGKMRIRYHLEQLRARAATAAVQKPLEVAEKSVEAEAVKELVDQLLQTRVEIEGGGTRSVRGEFVEPVQLQVVCRRLWGEVAKGESHINANHVAELGPLDNILADFYEEGIRFAAERTRTPEKKVRRVFEKELITSAGTRGLVHRGRQTTAGLSDATWAALEEQRLVRREWRAGAQWYEIPHDALIEPIRRTNKAWRERRQRSVTMAAGIIIALFATATITCTVAVTKLSPRASLRAPEIADWVRATTVTSAGPFRATFTVVNRGKDSVKNIGGTVLLRTPYGQGVARFAVEPFSVGPGEAVDVVTAGPASFLEAGFYSVGIEFDLPGYGLVVASESSILQILPIELPLAPTPFVESGIRTLVQEPASWGLDRIRARDAWMLSHGSSEVVVAVIDSGIDSTIPQLAESVWVNADEIPDNGIDDDHNGYIDDMHGWDFRDGDNTSLAGTPIHSHGTAIAAIIAARPGRFPLAGVAPGVKLMDVRFLDSSNVFRSGDWKTLERAIDYAADNGARIICLAFRANGRPPASIEAALARARERGVFVVSCTGDSGGDTVSYPGAYASVCAVGSTTESGALASFSNRGAKVDLCAPGEDIAAFVAGGRVATQSGTALAAAHVAGVAALMLSVAPELPPADVLGILRETATDLGPQAFDESFGYGEVDARRALFRLKDSEARR
jgi:subtilisin family serine protease